MIGSAGVALTSLGPGAPGRIATRGEIWQAVSDEPIPEGAPRARRRRRRADADRPQGVKVSAWIISPALIAAFVLVVYIVSSIKILAEYERGVIFRLGKLLPQPKGPGVILVFAPIDRMVRVSLRTVVLDVPPQDVITRDNVSVKVNAVVYFRVMDPRRAIVEVENYLYATSQLAQTTLRSVLGQVELDELLSQRERLNQRAAADPRPAHRSVGHQGVGGRGEARRPAAGHAARDGAAGRGRAREARQDHPRRRRARGVGEAGRGRRRHRRRAGRHHAALPADADRDRRRRRTRRSSSRCRSSCSRC